MAKPFEFTRFALSTAAAGGTQDVTIPGFGTPKAAMFILTAGVTDDVLVGPARMATGYTDGVNNGCAGNHSSDTSSNSITSRRQTDTACITLPDVAGSGTELSFSFNSWITDGIRLDIDNDAPAAYLVTCILFGDQVTDAYVGTENLGTSTSPQVITDPGFEPDLVFMAGTGQSSVSATSTFALGIFGAGVNDGADTQYCSHYQADDAKAAATCRAIIDNTSIGGQIAGGANNLLYTVKISDYDAQGFTLTTNASGQSDRVYYLAVKFATDVPIELFDVTWPDTGDYTKAGLSFQPSVGLITSIVGATPYGNVVTTNNHSTSVAVFDDTSVITQNISDQDGQTTTKAKSLSSDQLRILDWTSSDGIVASSHTMNADGWTFPLTTNPATPVLGWGLAIGPGGAAPAVIQFDGPDIINQSAIQDSLYTFDANGEGIVNSRFSGTGSPFVYEKSPAGGAWPDGISVNGTTGNPVGSPIVNGTFAGLAIRASTESATELFTTITEGSGATWNGTTLTLSGLNATGQLAGTPTNGTEYHLKFDYDVAAGEFLFIRCGGGANQDSISGPAVGSYDEVLISQGTDYLAQLAVGGGTHTFSNFSVKEVLTVSTADTNLFDMVIDPAAIDVDPDDLTQGQILTEVVLSLSGEVVPNDMDQAQSIDNITLTQAYLIIPEGLGQPQSIDEVSLEEDAGIPVDNIGQSQSLDEVVLAYAAVIVPNGLTQSQKLQNIKLVPDSSLDVANLSQSQVIENIDLLESPAMLVNAINQTQGLENLDLTQAGILDVHDLTQAQLIDIVRFGGVVVGELDGDVVIFALLDGKITLH